MDGNLTSAAKEELAEEPLPSGPPEKKAKLAENGDSEGAVTVNLWKTRCQVCNENNGKYRCPGCEVVTCSLSCSKAHRKNTGCSGSRNRTAFVPLSQFNEQNLLSDIHLLDDFCRASQNAKRQQARVSGEKQSKRMKILEAKAKQFGLRLHFLPSMMTKHRHNSTRFDIKQQTFFWHVELHFDLLGEDTIVALSGLDDSLPADQAIQRILALPANQSLSTRVSQAYPQEAADWRFYLLQPMCPAHHPLYHPLLPSQSIRQVFSGTDILEYPTIHVSTAAQEDQYELFSDESYKSRSTQHLEHIESLAQADSSADDSSDSDSDESSSDDTSSDDDSSSSSEEAAASISDPPAQEATLPQPAPPTIVQTTPAIASTPLVSRYRNVDEED